MTRIRTEDGTIIIVDPDVGTISAHTEEAAQAELRRRRLAAQQNARAA